MSAAGAESQALVVYLGQGISPFPKRDPQRLVDPGLSRVRTRVIPSFALSRLRAKTRQAECVERYFAVGHGLGTVPLDFRVADL